jgi:pre-mRNA branch site protein p14
VCTAFVVYDDIFDAKAAVEALRGFNVGGRYLIATYYNAARHTKKQDAKKKAQELAALKAQHGIVDEDMK